MTMNQYKLPVVKVKNHNYSHIVLDGPMQTNSLLYQHVYKLFAHFQSSCEEENTKVIIFSGSEGAFRKESIIAEKETLQEPLTNFNYTISEFYKLYYYLATTSKPIISFMDGTVTGAGAGISQLSAFKIATENSRFSLSQGQFSHFCDTSNSFILSRLDGHLGVYLLLTGHELKAEELVFAGLASHFVYSNRIENVISRLSKLDFVNPNTIDAAIQEIAAKNVFAPNLHASFWEKSKVIERCFQYNTMEQIFKALEQDNSRFANLCLESMLSLSPTSLKVGLAVLRYGANKTLSKCLDYEYRAWRTLPFSHDYQEEIKALLEGRKPRWNPSKLENVRNYEARYLSPVDFAPVHCIDHDFITSPYQKYLVPSKNEIRQIEFKNGLTSTEEIVDWLSRDRLHKFGVKEKVEYTINKRSDEKAVKERTIFKDKTHQYYNRL